MKNNISEVFDVGMLDCVVRHRSWNIDLGSTRATRNQHLHTSIPENIMSALEEHLGDGLAKVTVGCELAHNKEFGCKAQSFVSVSVTCGNNEHDINAVHGIVQSLARQLTNTDLEAMKLDRDAHMTGSATTARVSSPPGGRVSSPPKAQGPALTAKAEVNRPSFRR